jgi:NAD(P)-dependent dehydrogenase (short-subunit alcohol dehydrogenase family)
MRCITVPTVGSVSAARNIRSNYLRYSAERGEMRGGNKEDTMAVAIVTGASRGLGRALARALSADGWSVVADARDAEALDRAAAAFGPGTVRIVPGDVSDPAHRAALVAAARDLGGIDLLVNNASVLGPSPQPALADYPLDVFTHVYDVNVVAPLALTQLALPGLRERGGAIVNVTSDAGVEAYEGWGGYGSSKAALEQLGNILGVEEPDVHVYTFDPGDMRTQMHQEAFPGEDISDRPEPETVVPALLHLVRTQPASGRYRAADLHVVSP